MGSTQRGVRVTTEPHDAYPFKTVIVNGIRIGRVRKTETMGFLVWTWAPASQVPEDGAALADAVPENKQFGSLAEVRRYFAELVTRLSQRAGNGVSASAARRKAEMNRAHPSEH